MCVGLRSRLRARRSSLRSVDLIHRTAPYTSYAAWRPQVQRNSSDWRGASLSPVSSFFHRFLRSLLNEGCFFVWSFVVLFLSCVVWCCSCRVIVCVTCFSYYRSRAPHSSLRFLDPSPHNARYTLHARVNFLLPGSVRVYLGLTLALTLILTLRLGVRVNPEV